jgi:NAD(P)-dependent dehydrogenase (short-subunit alcohol dehydrogenase family)
MRSVMGMEETMSKLNYQSAIVTGASRGLGLALMRRLVAASVRVVGVARDGAALERVVSELRQAGGDAHAVAADIADKHAPHRIAGVAAALIGPIDLLIHNASSLGATPLRPLLDTECEDLATVHETNLVGPFRLTKIIAGAMALRGHGAVVHVSSDAALEAYPNWGAYSASKAAQDQLARVLAAELAPNVRVLSVDPGEMDTEMHAAAVPDADRSTLAAPDEVASKLVMLLRRLGPTTGTRFTLSNGEAA